MNKPEQKFPVNARVRLRDGVDPGLYGGFSRVGNEGWIRKRRRDKYGYPQVFIEWNRDNWAYNGTEDCWTWEGHFEAVEENSMADSSNQEDQIREITERFVKAIFSTLGTGSQDTSADEPEEQEAEGDGEKWEDLIAQAQSSLSKAPAYLLVVLEHADAPNAPPMIIPRVFHGAKDADHALIVQSQLAHIVALFQDSTIASIFDDKKKGDNQ